MLDYTYWDEDMLLRTSRHPRAALAAARRAPPPPPPTAATDDARAAPNELVLIGGGCLVRANLLEDRPVGFFDWLLSDFDAVRARARTRAVRRGRAVDGRARANHRRR